MKPFSPKPFAPLLVVEYALFLTGRIGNQPFLDIPLGENSLPLCSVRKSTKIKCLKCGVVYLFCI